MPVLIPQRPQIKMAVHYRRLPLVQIIQSISHHSDPAALHELHENRTVFQHGNGPRLLLAEYLQKLRESPAAWRWCSQDAVVVDRAYDLASDKFSRLPGDPVTGERGQSLGRRRTGPDCRYYFRAFLDHLAKHLNGPCGEIEQEVLAARRLQIFVYRHFMLSCLECVRRSRHMTRRFFWRVSGGSICLWMPSGMKGSECRTWLESNVEAPNPCRPGERVRVQGIVDQRLGRPRVVRLGDTLDVEPLPPSKQQVIPWSVQYDLSTDGLAEAVAREKSQNIHQQRPAIRRLGPDRLEEMIRRIFQDLASNAYRDVQVAREFNLSKASLSRFCGSRWTRPRAESAPGVIPDLWRNTAQVLAGNPVFTESAKAAGVWDEVIGSLETPV